MYNANYGKSNAAQTIGTLVNIVGVIVFLVVIIGFGSGPFLNLLFAFVALIGNLALGTILTTLGNIQRVLEEQKTESNEHWLFKSVLSFYAHTNVFFMVKYSPILSMLVVGRGTGLENKI